jgi:hypothetical protein
VTFLFDRPNEPVGIAVGSKVVVRRDPDYGPGPWPAEPAGRIVAYPDGSAWVNVTTQQGPERSWLVRFDEPQHDVDGDGPYRESQVLERYLRAIE